MFAAAVLAFALQADCDRLPVAEEFKQESAEQIAALVRINGRGTNHELAAVLLDMRSTDQEIRKKILALPNEEQKKLDPELDRTDAAMNAKLKDIVAKYGWPTIALVGVDASQAATLILIHSPDHAFQRQWIPELQKLVEEKKIVGSDVAVLIDKELRSEGKQQRFGTSFSRKENGPMTMDPVEDPAHLEERRRIYLLPPMELYKCILGATYHREIQ